MPSVFYSSHIEYSSDNVWDFHPLRSCACRAQQGARSDTHSSTPHSRRTTWSLMLSIKMKLSEKTLELNICAQFSAHFKGTSNVFWFGLTQQQEAKAGFDACTKLNGKLLIFQFKASNHVLKRTSRRKFLAPHHQLSALQTRSKHSGRSIFYAFPLVGNTSEIKKNPDLLLQTWLLDVSSLPYISAPTKKDGTLRKNKCHNIYVKPGMAIIRSDPIHVKLINCAEFVSSAFDNADGVQYEFSNSPSLFLDFCKKLGPGARGMFIYD